MDHTAAKINLVDSGFNNGLKKVQGAWNDNKERIVQVATIHPEGLVNFDGNWKYTPPEFTWSRTVRVAGLSFLNPKLGKQYENDLL
jgi:hypothetical protein